MESIQAWLNDKKNLPKVVGALVAVAIVALAVVMLTRKPADDTTAAGYAPTAPAADPMAIPGGPPPGAAPAADPAATAAAAPAAPAGQGGGSKKEPPLQTYRSDPFRPFFGPKPKRTKPVFMARLTKPDIRQVAPVIPGPSQIEAQRTLPPQPARRMAGLLKNNRVFAIIESEGQTTIVKPGDIIDENLMVDRITNDKVILRSRNTAKPEFVEVPRSAGPPRPRPTATGNLTSPGDTGPGRRGTGGGGTRVPVYPGPGGPGPEGAPPPPAP